MIDFRLYIVLLFLFFSNFIRFSKEDRKNYNIRIILIYIFILRLIYDEPMLIRSITAIFSSIDIFVFAFSSIAILILFILLYYKYTHNRSNYSPSIMFLAFFLGMLSTRIVTDIYTIFDHITILNIQFMSQILQLRFGLSDSILNNHLSILIFSLFVGFTEEFAKYILFLLIIYFSIKKKDKYNIILYISFIALGFSLIENIYYSLEYGHFTRVMRNIFAGHLIFSLFMGYLTYKADYAYSSHKKIFYIVYCFLFVSLLHATWNFLAFVSMFNLHANIIFYILYGIMLFLGIILSFSKTPIY